MLYSALFRLFVAILRRLAYSTERLGRNVLGRSQRLWALFLQTARHLFASGSRPGHDSSSLYLSALSSIPKISDSADDPTTRPPDSHADVIDIVDKRAPSPCLPPTSILCTASTVPEIEEIHNRSLREAEEGEVKSTKSSLRLRESEDLGIPTLTRNEIQQQGESELSPEEDRKDTRYDDPEGTSWKIIPCLPDKTWLNRCVRTSSHTLFADSKANWKG